MSTLDLILIFFYIALSLVVGIVVGLRGQTGESFWVSERRARFLFLAFSVISTQVGAGAIIGIGSGTYSGGIGLGLLSILSTTIGFLAIAYLAPAIKGFGDKFGAVSLSEFFEVRYGNLITAI